MIFFGRFKIKVLERDVEVIFRIIFIYCFYYYKGDEKVKGFIRDFIKVFVIRERLFSEERDVIYIFLLVIGKIKIRNKKGKILNKNKSVIVFFEVSSEWRTCDLEIFILDEGYKKYL